MSGANLAYHLRVNKHIDRCLFIEVLHLIATSRRVGDYGYVSMGGNFLEDFRVVHQELGISRMYSFDGSRSVVTRQEVNKPYGFIKCATRFSNEVVGSFDALRAEQFGVDRNVIVWLDYTMPGERQQQLIDVEVLAAKLVAGDVLRVTMNANRTSLGSNEEWRRLHETGKTEYDTLWAYRQEKLEAALGQQLPEDRKDSKYLQNNQGFLATLARAIKKAAITGLSGRPELRIEPLLAVSYSDGQEMITVTAVVLTVPECEQLWDRPEWINWPHKPGPEWDDFVEVDVPHLSIRERQALHAAMNEPGQPNLALINFALDKSPAKSAELFEQYRCHYLRYPTFAPLDVI